MAVILGALVVLLLAVVVVFGLNAIVWLSTVLFRWIVYWRRDDHLKVYQRFRAD